MKKLQRSFYRVSEVGNYLGVSSPTVYSLLDSGKLDGVYVTDRSIRVSKASIDSFLQRQQYSKVKEKKFE